MRRASSLLLVIALVVGHAPAAFAGDGADAFIYPEPPMPRWAMPFHRRHPCKLRLLALAGALGLVAWGAGAFDATKPDEPVPSHPVPDHQPQPPQQFPPAVMEEVPDLP